MFTDAPSCLTESSGRVSAHACPVQHVTLRSAGVCHEWSQRAPPHFGVVVPSLITVHFWGPAQVSVTSHTADLEILHVSLFRGYTFTLPSRLVLQSLGKELIASPGKDSDRAHMFHPGLQHILRISSGFLPGLSDILSSGQDYLSRTNGKRAWCPSPLLQTQFGRWPDIATCGRTLRLAHGPLGCSSRLQDSVSVISPQFVVGGSGACQLPLHPRISVLVGGGRQEVGSHSGFTSVAGRTSQLGEGGGKGGAIRVGS